MDHDTQNNFRKESMTSVNPDLRHNRMTGVPPDYYQQRELAEKNQLKTSFFKRLFFAWDMREIESELQRLKISKSDLIESSFQKSEIGFFNLFFQMIPTVTISLLSLFLSLVIFIALTHFSIYLSIIGTIVFLQATIGINAAIVYELDKHKIGERATGRFIKNVRAIWHVFETIYIILLIVLGALYFTKVNWNQFAIEVAKYKFKTPIYQIIWQNISKFICSLFHSFTYFITYLFITYLLFAFLYLIGSYTKYLKSKKEQEKAKFAVDKEVLDPADLARKKFNF